MFARNKYNKLGFIFHCNFFMRALIVIIRKLSFTMHFIIIIVQFCFTLWVQLYRRSTVSFLNTGWSMENCYPSPLRASAVCSSYWWRESILASINKDCAYLERSIFFFGRFFWIGVHGMDTRMIFFCLRWSAMFVVILMFDIDICGVIYDGLIYSMDTWKRQLSFWRKFIGQIFFFFLPFWKRGDAEEESEKEK